MKFSEELKVSYVVRLQKQGKLGAGDASCLSKSLLYLFSPHSPYRTKLCFLSPWSKSPEILSLYSSPCKMVPIVVPTISREPKV